MIERPTKYHRHSIRLKEYDYTLEGAYFITLVARRKECIFGKINQNEMQLSDLGTIARECWNDIPNHFPDVTIEPYVIMPNHIHGVITILENCRGTIYRAPTEETINRAPTKEAFGHPIIGSVPTIIRTYKAAVSRIANKALGFAPIWQRNYYEHIIRNNEEYKNIWDYIDANAPNWHVDQFDSSLPFMKAVML